MLGECKCDFNLRAVLLASYRLCIHADLLDSRDMSVLLARTEPIVLVMAWSQLNVSRGKLYLFGRLTYKPKKVIRVSEIKKSMEIKNVPHGNCLTFSRNSLAIERTHFLMLSSRYVTLKRTYLKTQHSVILNHVDIINTICEIYIYI